MESVSLSSLVVVAWDVESCCWIEVMNDVEVEELLWACWCCGGSVWLWCCLFFGVIKVGGFVDSVWFLDFPLLEFLSLVVAL